MGFQLTFKCESVMIVGYTEKLHDLAKHAHMYNDMQNVLNGLEKQKEEMDLTKCL